MRIEYLLFPIYIALSIWLIPKIAFIKHTDLSSWDTRLLLVFKILLGVLCAYYFENFSGNFDYAGYNDEGKIQYELLLSNPTLFFTDFNNDIQTYGFGGLFESKDSFWAYLRFNLLYKFIAVVNLVTRGNFYFNTAIFSSIVFLGHIAFYRIYSEMYTGNKLIILIACFCLPSLLLYTSCFHKDGIVFASLGLISYIFYRTVSASGTSNSKYILFFLLGLATIFLFRNYVIIAIVPAMITALLCKTLPFRKRYIILITYLAFFSIFFLSGLTNSFFNLPAAIVQRKADFAALGDAKTNIPMNELYPTVQSFIHNIPQAVNHFLFRPYLWEFSQPAVLLTALELFVYQLIALLFIFYRKRTTNTTHLFNIYGLAFLFNMMLIIGYTIPNIGAIVRYRSIFWVFLICPLLCNTDWKKLFSFRKPARIIDN